MPSPVPSDDRRCSHTTRTGRRCRMERLPDESLCYHHWSADRRRDAARARQERALINDYYAGSRLLRKGDRFDTAEGVNKLLTRAVKAVACGQLEPKMAASIGYLGQVLLSSTSQIARDRAIARELGLDRKHPILTNEQLEAVNQLLGILDDCIETERQNAPSDSAEEDLEESSPDATAADPQAAQEPESSVTSCNGSQDDECSFAMESA